MNEFVRGKVKTIEESRQTVILMLTAVTISFSFSIGFLYVSKGLNGSWDKNAGFIILLTSIFTFFFFGEIRNLTTFTRLMDYNNGFSLSSFFLSLLSFLWIGAQFPQEKFLSYGRILTLHYYFLLLCILFSFIITGVF